MKPDTKKAIKLIEESFLHCTTNIEAGEITVPSSRWKHAHATYLGRGKWMCTATNSSTEWSSWICNSDEARGWIMGTLNERN